MRAGPGRLGILALGSNLAPRERHLDGAWTRLEQLGMPVRSCTPRWNTRPLDAPPQPDFLNQLLLVAGPADAEGWLEVVAAVEGPRAREVARGPRRLDVDVVAVEGLASNDRRILLPHPGLETRPFALLGCCLLAPGCRPRPGGPTFTELALTHPAPGWAPPLRGGGGQPAPGWPGE